MVSTHLTAEWLHNQFHFEPGNGPIEFYSGHWMSYLTSHNAYVLSSFQPGRLTQLLTRLTQLLTRLTQLLTASGPRSQSVDRGDYFVFHTALARELIASGLQYQRCCQVVFVSF